MSKNKHGPVSYHTEILIPKYGQADKVKLLTPNHGLPFAIRWPNLNLKVSTKKKTNLEGKCVISIKSKSCQQLIVENRVQKKYRYTVNAICVKHSQSTETFLYSSLLNVRQVK